MRGHNRLWTISVFVLGLLASPVESEADYDYDSRRVYDVCSPDQIETVDGVKVEWGHYRQWQTVNGTLSGPGSFVTAAWNTCIADPDYTTVSWRGTGQVTFWVRGARDGDPRGRGLPGSWSEWIKLAGSEQNLPIPEALDGKQWIQLKAVLDPGANIKEFSIHKRMVLPDHPRILLTSDGIREVREKIATDSEIARIYAHYIHNFKTRAGAAHTRAGKNCWTVGHNMTSLGIAWNLSGDAFFLDAAKEQLARLESPWAKGLGHFDRPQLLGGAATCLDLVWNGLTRPEQVRFAKALLVIADEQQKAWRFSDVSNQIYTNSGKNILTGIALAGANVDRLQPPLRACADSAHYPI